MHTLSLPRWRATLVRPVCAVAKSLSGFTSSRKAKPFLNRGTLREVEDAMMADNKKPAREGRLYSSIGAGLRGVASGSARLAPQAELGPPRSFGIWRPFSCRKSGYPRLICLSLHFSECGRIERLQRVIDANGEHT
jgi:hypothetical protein